MTYREWKRTVAGRRGSSVAGKVLLAALTILAGLLFVAALGIIAL